MGPFVGTTIDTHESSFRKGQDLTALEFISFGAHIGSEYGGAEHASNRANSGRQDVLLSSLWSTLFGDVFAAFQE
jgi:hypothetical protein